MSALLDVKVTAATRSRRAATPTSSSRSPKSPTDLLPLDFTLDPTPRFSVEVYTATNKRAEMPAAHQPPGRSGDSETAPTTARVQLYAGASHRQDGNGTP